MAKTKRSTSTELTGGGGFDYEHRVASLYLTALLRSEFAPGTEGKIVRVALQQEAFGEPMDDLIVDAEVAMGNARLGLQVKTSLTISSAESNDDFRTIISNAEKTLAKQDFQLGRDGYGFVAYEVSDNKIRTLKRIIDWAIHSPSEAEFNARFVKEGQASINDHEVRNAVQKLLSQTDADHEWNFLRHFVALKLDVFDDKSPLSISAINNLSELLSEGATSGPVLWTDLCNQAKNGGKLATVWTRETLIAAVRPRFVLTSAPIFVHDMEKLRQEVHVGLRQINNEIGGYYIPRSKALGEVALLQESNRFINITGLPGCGKSVVLKTLAEDAAAKGPILFLKSDRLNGTSWGSHASSLGLQHRNIHELLVEVGGAGTPTLFVDGVDRIKVEQRQVLLDLLDAIFLGDFLNNWNVVVTSREQGLEAFRNWLGPSLVNTGGFKEFSVGPMSDEEAKELSSKVPSLRGLLFGEEKVKEIARRPFFASILAQNALGKVLDAGKYPSTESELIQLWWQGGGLNADITARFQRQRALIDLAICGSDSLGKKIPANSLNYNTVAQVSLLESDQVIQPDATSSWLSFAHDVFFEWAFFQHLKSLETAWLGGIKETGEAPLLGRIVEILSQDHIEQGKPWSDVLSATEQSALRRQWTRAWLLGPSGSPKFYDFLPNFEPTLFAEEGKWLKSFLIWFQAEKTIPNPLVLANGTQLDAEQRMRIADATGWPSDYLSWSRVIYWLISRWENIPAAIKFQCIEIFSVWQNMHRDFENGVSQKIIELLVEENSQMTNPTSDEVQLSASIGEAERKSVYLEKLRDLIFLSSFSYPDAAKKILSSVKQTGRGNQDILRGIFMFAPLLSHKCGKELAELTFSACQDKFPKERLEESRKSQRYYSAPRLGFDEIGLQHIGTPFFPATPLKEPFQSLLNNAQEAGLELIKSLSNRAVKGWLQVHELDPKRFGTPIPLRLHFPWGEQEFRGGKNMYLWSRGSLGPQPIESAYLALSHWALKKLESGQHPDELIKKILQGNDSVAALGLAVSIILESQHISETSLPIISSLRVWDMDINRQAQEFTRNINLLGIDPLHGTTEPERAALEYLDNRAHKDSTIKNMAPAILFSSNQSLIKKFQKEMAAFESQLPFYHQEELTDENHVKSTISRAAEWARMAEPASYQAMSEPDEQGKVPIAYVPQQPTTAAEINRQAEAQRTLGDYNVYYWVKSRLSGRETSVEYTLEELVDFAKTRVKTDTFKQVERSGEGIHQAAYAALAALILREVNLPDMLNWAWSILDQIDGIEPNGESSYGKNEMDPRHYLVVALADQVRKTDNARAAERLLRIACAKTDDVSEMAFLALFNAAESFPNAAWAGGVLASQLAAWPILRRSISNGEDEQDTLKERNKALFQAIEQLTQKEFSKFAAVPPAWVYADRDDPFDTRKPTKQWQHPKHYFDWGFAKTVYRHFPIESWIKNPTSRQIIESYSVELCSWMKENLDPTWMEATERRNRSYKYGEFPSALGQLISRLAPFFEPSAWLSKFVEPFQFNDHDEGEQILGAIVSGYCCRHILDSKDLSHNSMVIHSHFVNWLKSRNEFRPTGYRDGRVFGHYAPDIIKDILFVAVENASGSCRFANGNWKDISSFAPAISVFMKQAGWVPYVMEQYLTMCERAGVSYPVQSYCDDILAAFTVIEKQPELWSGLLITARVSARIQDFAENLNSLQKHDRTRLLTVLDKLIDLGDRRAVALEQSEAFRNVQQG